MDVRRFESNLTSDSSKLCYDFIESFSDSTMKFAELSSNITHDQCKCLVKSESGGTISCVTSMLTSLVQKQLAVHIARTFA